MTGPRRGLSEREYQAIVATADRTFDADPPPPPSEWQLAILAPIFAPFRHRPARNRHTHAA